MKIVKRRKGEIVRTIDVNEQWMKTNEKWMKANGYELLEEPAAGKKPAIEIIEVQQELPPAEYAPVVVSLPEEAHPVEEMEESKSKRKRKVKDEES